MAEQPTIQADTAGPLPRRIGNYVIKRRIASGGMGTVYEAQQEQPRRPVAIKVMRQCVASGSALRRFQYESQLLARLRHPHIAQVYEAGTFEDKSGPVPFFAMEYIPNPKSITDYVSSKQLNLRQKLELFATVCDAVHHGHQKGIIHRDLKPDNILVDSHGEPKVIDFGVARATDSDMALTTMQTEVGQLVGTLHYMSPEQTDADPHDIDIRSDVYALGVILFEILTGSSPYDLESRPPIEATRIIRETSPRRPSAFKRALRGDVETIVLKALEKDRERRYQSAAGLAGDIRRYLNNLPIIARPPSLLYQLRVFGRRNRPLVGAVAALFLVLCAGAVTSTTLYFREQEQHGRAERQSQRALAAVGYIFDIVKSANPALVGQEIKIGRLLDSYSERIHEAFSGQPEIEATVRTAIGQSYQWLDHFEYADRSDKYKREAKEHLTAALDIRRRILGDEHPETLASMQNLARLLAMMDDEGSAEHLLRQVWAVRERLYGANDPRTLQAATNVAENLREQGRPDEARPLLEQVLSVRRRLHGEAAPETIAAMSHLAAVLMDLGQLTESEALRRHAFDLDQKNATHNAANSDLRADLANSLLAEGRIAEARELYPGKSMPESLGIVKWLQGQVDLSKGDPTLLVFWEEWCGFSQAQLPRLEELYERFADRGLRIVGMAHDEEGKVRACLQARNLRYPNTMIDRAAMRELGVTGFPSACLFYDNALIWQAHPDRLSKEMFNGLLSAQPAGS